MSNCDKQIYPYPACYCIADCTDVHTRRCLNYSPFPRSLFLFHDPLIDNHPAQPELRANFEARQSLAFEQPIDRRRMHFQIRRHLILGHHFAQLVHDDGDWVRRALRRMKSCLAGLSRPWPDAGAVSATTERSFKSPLRISFCEATLNTRNIAVKQATHRLKVWPRRSTEISIIVPRVSQLSHSEFGSDLKWTNISKPT